MFSILLAGFLAPSSTAFLAPKHSSLHAPTKLHSYLDSLTGAPSLTFSSTSATPPPTSFGQMVSTDAEHAGITDICAFDAASSHIKSHIASSGSISATEIDYEITKANTVVNIIREHFPGALGSSEILRRVRRVLDGYGVENILLTQSGKSILYLHMMACCLRIEDLLWYMVI